MVIMANDETGIVEMREPLIADYMNICSRRVRRRTLWSLLPSVLSGNTS